MGGVVEVGGEVPTVAGQPVPADDHDGQTGRAEVLLGAAVHEVVDVPVDGAAQEVRAHVGHQRHVGRRQLGESDAADGLVAG